jgi:peptide/nickel transport system permease protein
MIDYVLRRSLHSAISLVALIVVVFFLARLTGNPADLYLPIDTAADAKERFMEAHGLNDPVIVQFGHFVYGLLHLDLGDSIRLGRPALDATLEAFPTTLKLALFSMTLAVLVAIVIGALATWRPNSAFDRLATIFSLAGASLPSFWVALVGVIIFAVNLRLLPTSGTGSIRQWVLPVAVLFLRPCGLLVQVVRGSMIDALSSAYVKTARAKGTATHSIIFIHALRNALLPVITVAADEAAGIINGAVIVETIFAFPGVGRLLIDSIVNRDFAVIQATIMITAAAIFALNVLIDIGYALLDPRIRYR